MAPPIPASIPLASATSATNTITIAPTATASFTPVCVPWAAASMMLAGRWPSSKVSAALTSSDLPLSTIAAGPTALMRAWGSSTSRPFSSYITTRVAWVSGLVLPRASATAVAATA
jgi:hypothetical protein